MMENEPQDGLGTTSRARFLGGAAGLTGLAFAGGVFTKEANAATNGARAAVADKRSYVSGNFMLSLDGGKNIGALKTAQGGQIYGEPVAEPSGGAVYQKKHIGGVKFSDITLQTDLAMPVAFYQWIADSWSRGAQRKDGAIVAADFNRTVLKQRAFTNALIEETTIPALDGASKETAYLTLKLSPESTVDTTPGGTVQASATKQQKRWLTSNFRLELGKLDTSRVSKIDSFTVKLTTPLPTPDLGDVTLLDPLLIVSVPPYDVEPGVVDFPNLRVTLAESSAKSWIDWYEDFVRNGNNSDEGEKSGSIKLLAPDLTELARIDLFGVGIFNLTDERPLDAASDSIRRFVAELYVERMAFVYPGVKVIGD